MVLLCIVLAAVTILALWWIRTGNDFIRKNNKVSEALSGIEVALTNRYDMLTKMLDTAKGYAKHEKDLFIQVIELRRGMTITEMNEKNAQLDQLSSRIHVVAENYPELRSAEIFKELQSGIRSAEQHLQAARRLYNSNVNAFNTAIEVFPASIVANAKKLQRHELFVAEEGKREDVKMVF